MSLLTYGACLQQLWAPDRNGRSANVALGFATLDGYVDHSGHYFGATVGRYANRIGGAAFTLDGVEYRLPANDGTSSLHGGPAGFDRRVWTAVPGEDSASVELRYTSADGEMGYPGTLAVRVIYTLAGDTLRIGYETTTGRPTVVNLTNHTCWNLAGDCSGTIADHVLSLAASRYTPIDADLIPTGQIALVAGTPLDFREPAPIGLRIRDDHPQLVFAHGYDHNFVLDREEEGSLVTAARVWEPTSGRVLEVETDGARCPALFRQHARRHARRDERPGLPSGRRLRARDPALPRLAEPAHLPVDGAAAGRAVHLDDDLPADDVGVL